jgi:flagellar assembly protein FliH
VQRLGREAEALAAREATAFADIEDQVVAAAVRIAEVIVGRELAQPDDHGRDAIARALALAPVHGDVTVRLHPADIAVMGDPASLAPGRVLVIVPDPSLTPGDCIVAVASCRIDARVGAALERAREVLT